MFSNLSFSVGRLSQKVVTVLDETQCFYPEEMNAGVAGNRFICLAASSSVSAKNK